MRKLIAFLVQEENGKIVLVDPPGECLDLFEEIEIIMKSIEDNQKNLGIPKIFTKVDNEKK